MASVSGEFEVDLLGDDIAEALEAKTKQFYDRTFGRGIYEKVMSGNGRQLSLNKKDIKDQKQDIAEQVTSQIRKHREELTSILEKSQRRDSTVDWEASRHAVEEEFTFPDRPSKPEQEELPSMPDRRYYEPVFGLLDYLIPSRRRKKVREAVESFKDAKKGWEEKCQKIRAENERRHQEYQQTLEEWREEVRQIEETKERELQRLEELRRGYASGQKDAVENVVEAILEGQDYPSEDLISTKELAYDPESQRVVVDVWMPGPEDVPRRKEVKYVKSRDSFRPKELSKKDSRALYEEVMYQGILRVAHEIFAGDEEEQVRGVVVNGCVESINEATGHEETKCTISLEASRDEILGLNLSRLDAKACFQDLKGVSASSLEEVSPVTPMAQVQKSDARFTEGREVGKNMEEGQNIAAMDWEEFEHLIRELFEKEFAEKGGEVNVTQSSRDGGIDAVIFDPDPLRGGKIVVQAKRYTRTVGVSSVRDLFGTVMNEGANKGILVTTSGFGPEAYDFAEDKPIQLLSGGNLLSPLEQHNYEARINVEEAREESGE
jgi:restriction system protein